jgi:hypothetical protein
MKAPVGRVYVLSNPAMPGLLKIGYTMNTVEGRVKELSLATGVPTTFCIEYQLECRDPAGLEAYAHTFFQSKRYNGNREFFSISINDAVEVLRQNAIELMAEELSDFAKETRHVKIPATLYLIRVNEKHHIFRIGLIQKNQDFLFTDEFKNKVIELYDSYSTSFFYKCEIIKSDEFLCSSQKSFQQIRLIVDKNIAHLKYLKNRTIHQISPSPFFKLDQSTIYFKEFNEGVPTQMYNSCLSLAQPLAKADSEVSSRQAIEELHSKQSLDF